MDLHVVGCHGGESPKHRPTAFVLDGRLAIDAGSLTSTLELIDQTRLEACLVSHAHLDHIRDLATLSDNRAQLGCAPLEIVGLRSTLSALKKHFFNDVLWPDFSRIPSKANPAIRYRPISPDKLTQVAGYEVRAVTVSHTIDCAGFIIERGGVALAFSGDTGPTEKLWHRINSCPRIRAILVEVSFPDSELALANVSGHLTPKTLRSELSKVNNIHDIQCLAYHIKPSFQPVVEKALARLRGISLEVPKLNDRFRI